MDRLPPYVAALLLDAVDLATLGPIGIWAGFVLGGVCGWYLSDSLGFKSQNRWMCAALAGLYCMLPGTGPIPAATLLTAFRRFSGPATRAAAPGAPPTSIGGRAKRRVDEEPIEVEYRDVE